MDLIVASCDDDDVVCDKQNVIVPITPDCDSAAESDDFPVIDLHSLTLAEGGGGGTHNDYDGNGNGNGNGYGNGDHSPHTPRDAVFDPFAPGPEIKMSHVASDMKYLDQLRLIVARQLNFDPRASVQHRSEGVDDDDDDKSLSDEDIVGLVNKSVLLVFVSKQIEEGVLAAAAAVRILNDLDDSCVGAPMKGKPGSKKQNNIQLGLCKKLEFS